MQGIDQSAGMGLHHGLECRISSMQALCMGKGELRLTSMLPTVEDLLFLLDADCKIVHCRARHGFLINTCFPTESINFRQILPEGVLHKFELVCKALRQTGHFSLFESMIALDSGAVNWYEFRLIPTLDNHAVLFIWNVNKYRSLSRTVSNLPTSIKKLFEGWSRALYLRDFETEDHTRRVTEMTMKLAQSLGLPETEQVNIRYGAQVHDIGKIAIPDDILLKTGQLSALEWEAMRKHPLLALNMLSGIPLNEAALVIPRSHHEKWDGSGYPHGLSGETIPLAARIFAFADVYDALTSDRPYRKAWSQEAALQYIQQEAGRHFDPALIPEFIHMVQR